MKSAGSIADETLLGTKTKDIKLLDPRKKTQASTERVARYLVDTFRAPKFYEGFLKVAWRLDEDTIHRLAGSAKELGRNPPMYFMVCAKNELARRGVPWRA